MKIPSKTIKKLQKAITTKLNLKIQDPVYHKPMKLMI